MAVCVKSMYNQTDVGSLFQAMSMHRAMGAEKVYTYTPYSTSPEVQKAFSDLAGSFVHVFDWALPSFIPLNDEAHIPGNTKLNYKSNCTFLQGQTLQLLDCHYRNIYLYKYLAVIDRDEFAFPMATNTDTVAMLDKISERNHHQVSSFVFFAYQSCFDYEAFQGVRLRRWGRRGKLYSQLWSLYRYKSIHRPELVTFARIHRGEGHLHDAFPVLVSPVEGVLYHYRKYNESVKCVPWGPGEENIRASHLHHRDLIINYHYERTKQELAAKTKFS